MIWFKKLVRAILALLPIFGVVFLTTPTNALKHEYNGILYGSTSIPCVSFDSSTNTRYIDWNSSDVSCNTYDGSGLVIEFKGDSYQSDYDNLHVKYSASYIGNSLSYDYYNNNSCSFKPNGLVSPIFTFTNNHQQISTSLGTPVNSLFTGSANFGRCNRFDKQFNSGMPAYDSNHDADGVLSCSSSNGAICDGLWNTAEYINDQILPYPYSSSGFYVHSKAISDEGIHYSNTFSFDDMFNSIIPTFSYLSIPLHSTDGYFLNPSNLRSGRQMEIAGSFEFDGSFAWHENINNNGSFFRIAFSGLQSSGSASSNYIDNYYDCTTNLITLESTTRLDYSCPFEFNHNYAYISGLRLEISGNDNYVWTTDSQWRFASTYIITDNDPSPGSSFNSNITGGGTIIGDAKNEIYQNSAFSVIIDGANFNESLIHLFGFTFINPFAPLLNMFHDQSSCVNIPIIAGMLHSESTEVCPFFPASVRQVVTPVLSISSVMLIFGFAVRWLGSSSGNMFEDTASETLVPPGQSGHWGRRKK